MTGEIAMDDTQASEWIEHDGGPRPVPASAIVTVRFRNHERVKDDYYTDTGIARDWDWYHDTMDDDIVSYRVVKP